MTAGLRDFVQRVRANRTTIGAALTWLAIAAFIAAAAGFTPVNRLNDNVTVTWAVIWSVIGILIMGVALRLHPRAALPWLADTAPAFTGEAWRPALVIGGLLLLLVGVEISAGMTGMAWTGEVGPIAQFIVLLLGLLGVAFGLIGTRQWRLPRPRWSDVVIVGAILLIALIVRVGGLEYYIRSSVDEVHYTTAIETFSYDGGYRADLLTSESVFLPVTMLFSFWGAGIVELVGWTWTGLRLTPALMGVVTVLAVYGAAYAVFNRRTAIIAAIIAATFPPALHFSRIAMPHAGDALFGTMLIMFIARGMRWNRRADWVWAGISLGLTQYFFEGGRFSFPPLTLGFFIWTAISAFLPVILRTGRPYGRFRPYLKGWWLLLLAFAAVAAPVYITMLATGSAFAGRMGQSSMGLSYLIEGFSGAMNADSQRWFWLHVTDPFLIYTFNPDRSGMWYSQQTAMVLQPIIPLFLLGVAQAVWRGRTAAFMLVPLLLLASAGSTLLSETLWYVRYILVMPAVALIIGIGIAQTWPLLWGGIAALGRGLRRGLALVPVGIAVIVAIYQIDYYFGRFMLEYHTPTTGGQGYRDGIDAVQRWMEMDSPLTKALILLDDNDPDIHLPRQMHSYFSARQDGLYSIEVADIDTEPPSYFYTLPRDRTYIFAVEPTDAETIARMLAAFVVEPPTYSPGRYIDPAREYLLFVAPHVYNLPGDHVQVSFPARPAPLEW